jgi:hypothetical protein
MSHYRNIGQGFEAITGIMPFLLVLCPCIMPFIMLHESRERRKLDCYDNVKLCTQFSCLHKKHHDSLSNVSSKIMLKRALLAAKQGNLKMHMRGVRVLLYKRAVSCKCIQITRSVESRIVIRLIAGIS